MNWRRLGVAEKKRKGCLGKFLLLILLLLLIAGAWLWFTPARGLVPDRAAQSAAGLTVDEQGLNILIVGSDENEAVFTGARADTVILAHINVRQKTVFLLSLPRDSLVEIPGHGEDKLNHAYAYGGMELLIDTVRQLCAVPVDYYALTNFAGFESIVDVLGGVEIEVDKRMYYQTYDGLIDIEAGLQRLDGKRALQYVRYRQDELGDIKRVERQQNFLQALFAQFTDNGYRKLPQLLPLLDRALETDISGPDLLRLGLLFRGFAPEDIHSITAPGDFANYGGISYWRLDQAALAETIALRFSNGEEGNDGGGE